MTKSKSQGLFTLLTPVSVQLKLIVVAAASSILETSAIDQGAPGRCFQGQAI